VKHLEAYDSDFRVKGKTPEFIMNDVAGDSDEMKDGAEKHRSAKADSKSKHGHKHGEQKRAGKKQETIEETTTAKQTTEMTTTTTTSMSSLVITKKTIRSCADEEAAVCETIDSYLPSHTLKEVRGLSCLTILCRIITKLIANKLHTYVHYVCILQ
jgi:hypothetical protein